jgi:hypothetical protein
MAGTDTRLALLGDYGDSAWYLASADGVHWNERRTKEGPRPLDICRLGDRFLGWIPSSQAFAVSVDGLGWDLLPGRFGVPGSSMNMLWDGKRTLAWYGDSVAWTTDGSAWTRAATRGFRYASHMVWNGSIYASCARTDTLALSADGIDWEVSVLPWKGATANDLAWTGSGFAVAGYVPAPSPAFAPEGGVMYSPDGKTWEAYDRDRLPWGNPGGIDPRDRDPSPTHRRGHPREALRIAQHRRTHGGALYGGLVRAGRPRPHRQTESLIGKRLVTRFLPWRVPMPPIPRPESDLGTTG